MPRIQPPPVLQHCPLSSPHLHFLTVSAPPCLQAYPALDSELNPCSCPEIFSGCPRTSGQKSNFFLLHCYPLTSPPSFFIPPICPHEPYPVNCSACFCPGPLFDHLPPSVWNTVSLLSTLCSGNLPILILGASD